MKIKYRLDCASLFLISVLLTAGWGNSAFADENRPLRSVQPDIEIPVQLESFYPHSVFFNSAIFEYPLTQHYINQYTSPAGIIYMNSIMERATLYLPFIKEEIKKLNIPPELAYLPVIESNFVITARSRSGAAGLWQFMLNSISPFGIKVNDILDERQDVIKSTRGALLKLADNYKNLGNWELALAAYNTGLGGINRVIQRTGIRNYWELSRRNELSQETIHFVPKFVAAAWVMSQPRRFGINIWNEHHEWTAIPLKRQISLDILASEADVDRGILRRLNAELIHGISPADPGYLLKVPVAHLEKINQVLERQDLGLIRYHYHVVRSGDTLWSMSRHYEVSIEMIEQHNSGVSGRYLKIGETLIIPAYRDITPPARITSAQNLNGQHIVQKGESLWALGIRYGIDPQILAEQNDMELNQILREGRTLKVPILE
ncbi:MAG: transglycosylase SLT domain-containing protein [Treponema sp.]|nr:transglycosylase SLT domain-containing protein [Treponema sp.]